VNERISRQTLNPISSIEAQLTEVRSVSIAAVSAVRAPRLPALRTMSFVTDCYAAEGLEGPR
jgi:hypothetical protein